MSEYVTHRPRTHNRPSPAPTAAELQDRRVLRRVAEEQWGGEQTHVGAPTAGLMLALGPQPRAGVFDEAKWRQGALLDTVAQWKDLDAFRASAQLYAEALRQQAARRDADKSLLERLPGWTHTDSTRARRETRKQEVRHDLDLARNLVTAAGRTRLFKDDEHAYLKAKPIADAVRNAGGALPDLGRFAPEAVAEAHRLLKAAPGAAGTYWRDPLHPGESAERTRKVTEVTNAVEAWLAKHTADKARAVEEERQARLRAAEAERQAAAAAFEAGLWGLDDARLADLLTELQDPEQHAVVAEHLELVQAVRAGGAEAYLAGIREEEAETERAKQKGIKSLLRAGRTYGKKGTARIEAAEGFVARRERDIATMGVLRQKVAGPTARMLAGLHQSQLDVLAGFLASKQALAGRGPGAERLAVLRKRVESEPEARTMLTAVGRHGPDYLTGRQRSVAATLERYRSLVERFQRAGQRELAAEARAKVVETVAVAEEMSRLVALQYAPDYTERLKMMTTHHAGKELADRESGAEQAFKADIGGHADAVLCFVAEVEVNLRDGSTDLVDKQTTEQLRNGLPLVRKLVEAADKHAGWSDTYRRYAEAGRTAEREVARELAAREAAVREAERLEAEERARMEQLFPRCAPRGGAGDG